MTSSTRWGGTPVCAMSDRITLAASSVAVTSTKTPPNRPTGVRSGEQITASCMSGLPGSEVEAADGLSDADRLAAALSLDLGMQDQLSPAVDSGHRGHLGPGPDE